MGIILTNSKVSSRLFEYYDFVDFEPPEGVATLDEMTLQGNIIINCTSGYSVSEKLVRSCLKTKSNFIDVFPNFQFAYDMRRKYHEEARENNLYFILSCYWETVGVDTV